MKILLDYNETTGNVHDKAGNYIGSFMGVVPFEQEKDHSATVELMKLGCSADDLIKLKANGLL